MKRYTILIIFSLLILANCSGSSPAVAAVENYLKAMVEQDAPRLSGLSCKDWESQALMELDSFQAVKASLENLACKEDGKDGDAAVVSCQGKILTTYNDEKQELDLSLRAYLVRQEGGEWRVCGYK